MHFWKGAKCGRNLSFFLGCMAKMHQSQTTLIVGDSKLCTSSKYILLEISQSKSHVSLFAISILKARFLITKCILVHFGFARPFILNFQCTSHFASVMKHFFPILNCLCCQAFLPHGKRQNSGLHNVYRNLQKKESYSKR